MTREEYLDLKHIRVREPLTFENLSYVQVIYIEMRRQATRVSELGRDICSKLNAVISAINTLSSLVGAGVNLSVESATKVSDTTDKMLAFVENQISRYEQLNSEISVRISELNSLIAQLYDEDGNLVTVKDEEGNEETRVYQDILKEKEQEEKERVLRNKVESAGFTYYPEMGKYTDLTFESNEEKMKAFDNFIYTKAMEAGLTDKEAKMAIVISRWETGNYSKEAKGSDMYNYILPSNNNICGAKGGSGEWANLAHDKNGFNIYDTIDQSAEHFTDFLKGGYFNQGLTSFTKMQPKYCPIDDPSDTKGVNSQWLGGCQSLYHQLFGEWVD